LVTAAKSTLKRYVAPLPESDPILGLQLSDLPPVVGYVGSFALTAAATIVAVACDSEVTIPNLSLIFVVPVIIAAVGFGLGPSLCSAVLGALAYNFFLTDPRYTLRVDDPANIWAICLLFVVGCIMSAVASTSRRRALDAALRARQATVLHGFSRDVVAAGSAEAIASVTANALAELFQVPAVVILVTTGTTADFIRRVGDLEPQEAELEAALASLETGTVVRAGIYPADDSRFDFWPVMTTTGERAVIGLAFDPDERPFKPDTLVDINARLLALTLERQHLRLDLEARPPG